MAPISDFLVNLKGIEWVPAVLAYAEPSRATPLCFEVSSPAHAEEVLAHIALPNTELVDKRYGKTPVARGRHNAGHRFMLSVTGFITAVSPELVQLEMVRYETRM